MRGYEKRGRAGTVVERVLNVVPGSWRDTELAGWVTTRQALCLDEGWHLIADDDDSGTGGPALPGDHVAVADIIAAAEQEARRRERLQELAVEVADEIDAEAAAAASAPPVQPADEPAQPRARRARATTKEQ